MGPVLAAVMITARAGSVTTEETVNIAEAKKHPRPLVLSQLG